MPRRDLRRLKTLFVLANAFFLSLACLPVQQVGTQQNPGQVGGALPDSNFGADQFIGQTQEQFEGQENLDIYTVQPTDFGGFTTPTFPQPTITQPTIPQPTLSQGPQHISTGSCPFDAVAAENAIVQETNNFRQQNGGSTSYQLHEGLWEMARDWSMQMGGRGNLQHRSSSSLLQFAGRFGFRSVGENIALAGGYGFGSPSQVAHQFVHQQWANSSGHRAAMLDRNNRLIGAGVYCANDGTVFATQNFGY